jgi:hypothetical protein
MQRPGLRRRHFTRETAAVRTIAFNDRCDAILATVVVRGSEPAAIEPAARVP